MVDEGATDGDVDVSVAVASVGFDVVFSEADVTATEGTVAVVASVSLPVVEEGAVDADVVVSVAVDVVSFKVEVTATEGTVAVIASVMLPVVEEGAVDGDVDGSVAVESV